MYEYRTTEGSFGYDESANIYEPTDDPEPPEGNGWKMCGAAASDQRLFWFWRRKVGPFRKEAPGA